MSVVTDAVLKTKFETGDRPSQSDFVDFIDSKKNNDDGMGRNLIIDGDFNHNQMGGTGRTSNGYVIDTWYQSILSGTTVSSAVAKEIDSNIDKNKITLTLTSSQFSFQNRLKGCHLHTGKNLSFFVKISSTGGLSDLGANFGQNFGSGGSATVQTTSALQNISASTTEEWFRFDLTVPSISGKTIGIDNFSQIYMASRTTQSSDIAFHKIRVIETPANLPSGVIPDWIKEEEDPLETKLKVLSYYWQPIQGSNTKIICNLAVNAGTQAIGALIYPTPMVNDPSLLVSDITDFTVTHAGITTATTNLELMHSSDDYSTGQIRATTAAVLTGGEAARLRSLGSGSPTFALDARY